MQTQPTVLLQHVTRSGRHHDWLIGDPTAPPAGPGRAEARLWTARVRLASWQWRVAGRLVLVELAPHRRVYLHAQGPVSEGRGVVRQVDRGEVRPLLWTPWRRVLEVRMRYYAGLVELRRLTENRWAGWAPPATVVSKTGKNVAGEPMVLL